MGTATPIPPEDSSPELTEASSSSQAIEQSNVPAGKLPAPNPAPNPATDSATPFARRRKAIWRSLVKRWKKTTAQVTGKLPVDIEQLRKAFDDAQINIQSLSQNISQNISQTVLKDIISAFSVGDAKIADILQRVRAELPTTEALLVGKPQAGKSSIVRGLTGVSADIVGQGFRPHTQNTQRYAYPSEDLPLLIFTDTVGLGDIGQETASIVQQLTQELQQQSGCARILILTVKITDFAVDQLRLIVQQLRKNHPNLPCLLAVTCLHEIYPPELDNHPSYPPIAQPADPSTGQSTDLLLDLSTSSSASEAIDRAFSALKTSFSGCFDRAVLIDFTREEDGFDPVFYGQAALRDALAELLPEAEAGAIYQLIDDQAIASDQLGNLYRDVGRRYISAFAVIAATLAAVPLPFATMPVLTALQVSMVTLLGKLYGQTLTRSQAGGVVSAIAGGFFAQAIGRELVKFIPGLGSVIAASWAAGYTWALGEGACAYFGDLMGGKKPDPERIQQVMAEAFESAKERFRSSEKGNKPEK